MYGVVFSEKGQPMLQLGDQLLALDNKNVHQLIELLNAVKMLHLTHKLPEDK